MSITINGAWFQLIMNDTAIPDATAEALIDQAINLLNTFGAELDNLVAGTGDYTSAQAGAVGVMAREIYQKLYKNAAGANVGVGGLNVTYSSDTQLLNIAEKLAQRLRGSSLAFVVGEDSSGLDEVT